MDMLCETKGATTEHVQGVLQFHLSHGPPPVREAHLRSPEPNNENFRSFDAPRLSEKTPLNTCGRPRMLLEIE